MTSLFRVACVFLVVALGVWPANAGETSEPYFVSIKDNRAFMREGPGENYRIKWVYHRKNLPVEVTAAFEGWRRVKDMDGEIGWIHQALLSRERTALIVGKNDVMVRRRADSSSEVVAEAEPGAVGYLIACNESACEVRFDEGRGWIERTRLWGVFPGEQF
jgi:SH3-like domain-containing protein